VREDAGVAGGFAGRVRTGGWPSRARAWETGTGCTQSPSQEDFNAACPLSLIPDPHFGPAATLAEQLPEKAIAAAITLLAVMIAKAPSRRGWKCSKSGCWIWPAACDTLVAIGYINTFGVSFVSRLVSCDSGCFTLFLFGRGVRWVGGTDCRPAG